jgi:hypothetical protein
LLNKIDLGPLSKDIDAQTQGSLNRLGEFLRRKEVLSEDRSIQRLRRVISIRNSFPIHSGNTAFLSACQDLGIHYPPASWSQSWNTLIGSVWSDLRALRLMLPG